MRALLSELYLYFTSRDPDGRRLCTRRRLRVEVGLLRQGPQRLQGEGAVGEFALRGRVEVYGAQDLGSEKAFDRKGASGN